MTTITKEVYALVEHKHGLINVYDTKATLKDILKIASTYYSDCCSHSDYLDEDRFFIALLDNSNCKFMKPLMHYNSSYNLNRKSFIENDLIKKFSNKELVEILNEKKEFNNFHGTKWFKIINAVLQKDYEKFYELTNPSCIIIENNNKIKLTEEVLSYLKNHIEIIYFSSEINSDFISELAKNDSFIDHVIDTLKKSSDSFNPNLINILFYSNRINDIDELPLSSVSKLVNIRMSEYILVAKALNKNANEDEINKFKDFYLNNTKEIYSIFNEISYFGKVGLENVNESVYTFLLENFNSHVAWRSYYLKQFIIKSLDPSNPIHTDLLIKNIIKYKNEERFVSSIITNIIDHNPALIKVLENVFDEIKSSETIIKILFQHNILVDEILKEIKSGSSCINNLNLIRETLANDFHFIRFFEDLSAKLYNSYFDECAHAFHIWGDEDRIVKNYINGNRYELHPLILLIVQNTRKYDAKLVKIGASDIHNIILKKSNDINIVKQILLNKNRNVYYYYNDKDFDLSFLLSDKPDANDRYVLYNSKKVKTVKTIIDKYFTVDVTIRKFENTIYHIYKCCIYNNSKELLKYLCKKIKSSSKALESDACGKIMCAIENYIELSKCKHTTNNFISVVFKAQNPNESDVENIIAVKKDDYCTEDFNSILDSFMSFIDNCEDDVLDRLGERYIIDAVMNNAPNYEWRYADSSIKEFQKPDIIII